MRAAWLLALGGCDGVLHLEKVSAPTDAHVDAEIDVPAGPFCADKQMSLLCADFEGAFPPTFVSRGVTYNLPAPASDVRIASVASLDGAGLSIDTTTTAFALGATADALAVTKIDIELEMRFDRVMMFTGEIPLVRIGVSQNDAGFGSCYVDLQLADSPKRLIMQHYCGNNLYPDVFATFPAAWNKLGLVLDLGGETATTFVNGQQIAQSPLGTGVAGGATPFAQVGFIGPGTAGISIDDVVAVASP